MKTLMLILCAFLLIGCNTEEEVAPVEKLFDPRVPGGTTIKNPKTQEVIGLTAEVEYNKVTLSWMNPSIYIGQNFKIHVYRIEGDGTSFTLPDPDDGGSSAFLYYPRLDFEPFEDKVYVDQNTSEVFNLIANTKYTYYVLIEKDGFFSEGKTVTVEIPELGSDINIPPPTQFWKNYASRTGGRPDPDTGTIFMDTLDAGIPTEIKNSGNMVYAKNGTMLFISDTDNNRVLVYKNQMGSICYDNFDEGEIEFDICIALNGMAPLTPYAVLGQDDFSSSYSCQDGANPLDASECLTSPTGLAVKGNMLFISDSGNNRVKIYDTAPTYGCYNFENMLGDETPLNCAPSRVIGKRGVSDLANYSLAVHGDASLSCPNGLEVYNNNLYIADTCNNRVVVARNATVPSLFECNALNWRTSKCVFGGVLGQANLTSAEYFEERWDNGHYSYDEIMDTITVTGTGDLSYLARHMRNPTVVKIREGKMYIASNEQFSKPSAFGDLTLHGRILRYDNLPLEGSFPPCTDSTFLTGCNATWVYGQRGFHRIPITPFGGNYIDVSYALKNVGGIELVGEKMFVTDFEENIVSIWDNAFDTLVPGSPANYRVANPLGVWDADLARAQPNLKGLSSIIFNQTLQGLVIFDAGSNYYYLIKIYSPNPTP